MTPLVYRRLSSMPPVEREILEVREDGTFALWRSVAPVVGRFGGPLPPDVATELARLAEVAAGGGDAPSPGALPADSGVEQLETGGFRAVFASGEDAGGGWGELLAACRDLTDRLTDRPLAAVALSLDPAAGHARLVHRGNETLALRLGAARVEVEAWRGTSNLAAVGARGFGLGRVEAGPGWAVEASIPPLETEPGDRITAEASFVVEDAGVYVPVTLLTTIVAG